MANVFDVLQERGFIEQATHPEETKELLGKESVTFYIGFDPTANSLHIGHFLIIMVMMHMQKHGHKPIALMGGGTGLVGDPTGKTDMRQMLSEEDIESNIASFKKQFSKFIDFDGDNALMLNNADWLKKLNYIELLRNVGVHFSVNRMLTAECFKSRMEKGLSFLEFNYMIMQSYDFLELFRRHNCRLQLGGNDQWANIIGGVELVRRVERESVFGMTFTLLTNSEGNKMGKTESGAIWLDPEKTSPYDFFQYWRNVADNDVKKCLSLLTFLPMDEVNRLSSLEGADINKAKEVLAYEVTKLVHNEDEAKKALKASKALFGAGAEVDAIPHTVMERSRFEEGVDILTLLTETELCKSRGEGRRLIKQNGISINDEKAEDFDQIVTLSNFDDDKLMLQRGKKKYHQIRLD